MTEPVAEAWASAILLGCEPSSVCGIDSSAGFVSQARQRIGDARARFETGDATHLPWESAVHDVTVSGLVLNFVRGTSGTRPIAGEPERWQARPGREVSRCASQGRSRSCSSEGGLKAVTVRGIDVPTVFPDFDDYWTPFLGRTGAAPTYLASVGDEVQEAIRLCLESRLAPTGGGPIELTARAWAVQGLV